LAKARRRRAARAAAIVGGPIRPRLADCRLPGRAGDAAAAAIIGLTAGRAGTACRRHRPLDRCRTGAAFAGRGHSDGRCKKRNPDHRAASSRIIAAPFSPIMIAGALVLPVVGGRTVAQRKPAAHGPPPARFSLPTGNSREVFRFGTEILPVGPKFWRYIKPLRQFP